MRKFFITFLVLGLSLGVGHLGVAGPNCAIENGDVNGDGGIDLSDAVYSLAFLFQGGPAPALFCVAAGPKEDDCAEENGDTNGDGGIDLSDAIYSLTFSFQGGPAPVPKCQGGPGAETICNDDMDNDGDGDTDCADLDCFTAPSCGELSTVVATGQTLCYEPQPCGPDDVADEISCADDTLGCFGQDGFYQAGCPNDASRFLDNQDGTVTDNCTGLMWQKETADITGDGEIHIPPDEEPADQLTWCAALEYCEVTLDGFAGHDDWRLPNIRELYSITDHGRKNPPIDTTIFGVLLDRYWSSTSVHADPADARYVSFLLSDRTKPLNAGELHREGKTEPYLVRAVRGTPQILPATGQTLCYDGAGVETDCATGDCLGQDAFYAAQGVGCPNDASRFSDNLDGTVTDNCTNLMWQKDTADFSGDGIITPDNLVDRRRPCDALAYCEGLVLTTNDEFKDEEDLGEEEVVKRDDWRLPNLLELHSIVDFGRSDPSMSDVFGGWGDHSHLTFGAPEYWSSSICAGLGCVDHVNSPCGRGFTVIFGCCHEDSGTPGRDDGGGVSMRTVGRDVYTRAVRGGGF